MNTAFLSKLNYTAKENSNGISSKKFADGYCIDVDIENESIYWGGKIKIQGKTSQNITKPEDWVVFECVNRLLEKGYDPENISLEKTYPAGHGSSPRLDICVTKKDKTEYLLIECKTYGIEFEKALKRLYKDGGQLFTYFKFSNKADVIMLYTSALRADEIVSNSAIIKIEEEYRLGDVKDFYDKWNKLTKDNGIFDDWVKPFQYKSKALTPNLLLPIKQEDSSFIFNRFLEILRHNVVSDKPNAFNKIFTLFLCKIYDEKYNEDTENELGFQWKEGEDDDVSFQLRLTDLYKNGMEEFLEKKVTDFSETEFEKKYSHLDDSLKNDLLNEFQKIRLEKNNEFAIKEVYDEKSFKENAKVVKEVVELLQGYKIRYTKKQQYLSDFFELLLTTGLKQESGQFFTPVPIAQFIIKSLPIDTLVEEKLQKGEAKNLLPFVMDYAAGSGHFLTETMHEIQRLVDKKIEKNYNAPTAKKLKTWKNEHFDWAIDYVYGIEKDYRLVKVGKVGCYLHGDGLANVIHGDGLSRFNHPDYKGKLKIKDTDFPQENKQFDIVVSNPPYSVSSFKNASSDYYKEPDFGLYNSLTDNSSEIECLFIERTMQLLKDGGVAGIILPSSILSNTGLYSKSREIILLHFDIVAIAELGSNTFMATGTNTVVLFLRRKNNYHSANIKIAVEKFFANYNEVTLNGIEKPITKYLAHVWQGISVDDYVTMLKKAPNKKIEEQELYKDYRKKIKVKNEAEFWNVVFAKEAEKLLYFIITYKQQVVLVKTGDKDAEKRFLGYEFSYRRGSEGIHAMQRGKAIDECTQLFDADIFTNPNKASTYIYKAFNGDTAFAIDEKLQNNISRLSLVDMLTFDRVEFEKNISLSIKKKVKIESKWELVRLEKICEIFAGGDLPTDRFSKTIDQKYNIPIYSNGIVNDGLYGYTDTPRVVEPSVTISARGTIGFARQRLTPFYPIVRLLVLIPDKTLLNVKFLEILSNKIEFEISAAGTPQLTVPQISKYKIPLPPKAIQQKIVDEIEKIEKEEAKSNEITEALKEKIRTFISYDNNKTNLQKLGEICEMKAGKFVSAYDIFDTYEEGSYPCFGGNGQRGFTKTFTHQGMFSIIGRQGALCGNVCMAESKFHATEHAVVVTALNEIHSIWLHHKLLSMNLNQYAKGTAQPGLSVENLKNVSLNVPSFKDQQKIVSEIQKLETKIVALEKELKTLPTQKEAVLKKYL